MNMDGDEKLNPPVIWKDTLFQELEDTTRIILKSSGMHWDQRNEEELAEDKQFANQ